MIPNVVKGGSMYGLVSYLVGPGRALEGGDVHVDPHVISGDGFLQTWYGTEMLDAGSVGEIVDYLEAPRRAFGTEMLARINVQDPVTGEKKPAGYRDQNVWHCSLSLKADEGPLADGEWDTIARGFMDRMGFTEVSGKEPCRWVAIHHGASKNGNDHIHIAASMVREDGTRWEGRYRDYARAQEACRELEVAHGLARVEGPAGRISERGEKPAERRQAAAAGLSTTAPKELADRLRYAALASTSEAEWVRRVRADGVVVKPYFAKGSTDVVSGYRAALKPAEYNDKLAFYGGSKLGRDLSLPRLREGWAASTPQSASAAGAEWQAAQHGQAPAQQRGREKVRLEGLDPGAHEVAASNFAAFNDRLAQVPVSDRAAWADAARDGAGVLSAWARLDPENSTELRAAAAAMGRSAQLRRAPGEPGRRVKESPMGTALILLAAAPGTEKSKVAGAVFLRQVLKTAEALRDHHRAAANLREAQHLQHGVVERLQRIQLVGYAPSPAPGEKAAARPRPEIGEQAREARRVADALTGAGPAPGTPRGRRPGGPDPLPNPLPSRVERPYERSNRNNHAERENDGR